MVMRWPEAAPAIELSTQQLNTQQDAKRIQWRGPARVFAWAPQRAVLTAYPEAALLFDVKVEAAPSAPVELAMHCGPGCAGRVDVTAPLREAGATRTLKLPLACLASAGVDLARVEEPFSLGTTGTLTLVLGNIRILAGAARDRDALPCPVSKPS